MAQQDEPELDTVASQARRLSGHCSPLLIQPFRTFLSSAESAGERLAILQLGAQFDRLEELALRDESQNAPERSFDVAVGLGCMCVLYLIQHRAIERGLVRNAEAHRVVLDWEPSIWVKLEVVTKNVSV